MKPETDHSLILRRHARDMVEDGEGYLEWVQVAEELGCPPEMLVEIWRESQETYYLNGCQFPDDLGPKTGKILKIGRDFLTEIVDIDIGD